MRGRFIILCLIAVTFTHMTAYAGAPSINIKKGDPGSAVSAPCRIEFAVSDDLGISSITVNGYEIMDGPGGTYYDCEWSVYRNGPVTVTATDNEGMKSSATVNIVSLDETGWKGMTETSAAAETAAATPPPETTVQETAAPVHETAAASMAAEAEEETVYALVSDPDKGKNTEPESISMPETEAEESLVEPSAVSETAGVYSETYETEAPEEETMAAPEMPEAYDISAIPEAVIKMAGGIRIRMPEAVLSYEAGSAALSYGERLKEIRAESEAPETAAFNEITDKDAEKSGDTVYVLRAESTGAGCGMLKLSALIAAFMAALYNISVMMLNRKRMRLYRLYMNAAGRRKGKNAGNK